MLEVQTGDRIKVTYKEKRIVHTNEFDVVCALPGKNFIVITNGLYKGTIDRFQVTQGKVKVEVISRKAG